MQFIFLSLGWGFKSQIIKCDYLSKVTNFLTFGNPDLDCLLILLCPAHNSSGIAGNEQNLTKQPYRSVVGPKLEDNVNFLKMEDDLIFLTNGRRPQSLENGRRP